MDSLRFIRCSTTLRALSRSLVASCSSSTIATHEFQPADSSRCFRCSTALDVLVASRCAAAIATHEAQPTDSLPCSRCCSALKMPSRFCCLLASSSTAPSQLMNARASLRFTRNFKQRRSNSRGLRRASAIATHEFQHNESLRFIKCSSKLRVLASRSIASRCSAAIATHEFQLADSLPCSRCCSALRMLSSFRCTLRCSATISTHEFQPADNSRLTRCSSPRHALDRFRTTSCHCACQLTHPSDSSRCIRCRTALAMRALSSDSSAPSQLMKAGASLRLTMNDTQRRRSSSCFRRFVAIATHEFQPADSLRFSICCSALDMLSRFRCAPAAASRAPSQPFNARASLRFTKSFKQRRMSSVASSRSDAIAAHEFQPAESLRFMRCSIPLLEPSRSSSAFRCSSTTATHEFQPADSLRSTK